MTTFPPRGRMDPVNLIPRTTADQADADYAVQAEDTRRQQRIDALRQQAAVAYEASKQDAGPRWTAKLREIAGQPWELLALHGPRPTKNAKGQVRDLLTMTLGSPETGEIVVVPVDQAWIVERLTEASLAELIALDGRPIATFALVDRDDGPAYWGITLDI